MDHSGHGFLIWTRRRLDHSFVGLWPLRFPPSLVSLGPGVPLACHCMPSTTYFLAEDLRREPTRPSWYLMAYVAEILSSTLQFTAQSGQTLWPEYRCDSYAALLQARAACQPEWAPVKISGCLPCELFWPYREPCYGLDYCSKLALAGKHRLNFVFCVYGTVSGLQF